MLAHFPRRTALSLSAVACAAALVSACSETPPPQAPCPEPKSVVGQVVCPRGTTADGDKCIRNEVLTVVGCPAGSHFEDGACLADVHTDCPAGMRFQPGKGCVPLVAQPIDGPPNTDVPPGLTAAAPGKCPAGMAFVKGGSFKLAGYRSSAGVVALVKDFCLDIDEVTVGAYKKCSNKGACPTAKLKCHPDSSTWGAGDDQLPLNCVDYTDSAKYCAFAGKRLATEDEWEWAARGGDLANPFPWGANEEWSRVCASAPNKRKLPCRVGSFRAGDTLLGIHDMAGSVWEWTTITRPADASSPGNHAIRGGGWDILTGFRSFAAGSRVSYEPGYRSKAVGFRCAKSAGGA